MVRRGSLVSLERQRLGVVFYVSLGLSLVFIAFGLAFPSWLTAALARVRQLVVDTVGPVYPVIVVALLIFILALSLCPLGRLRLGGPDAKPEFGVVSWFAMLFSAGVGLSFLFWGTAEPLLHLAEPPRGAATPGSQEAARVGMRYSFLFWGLHAWAVYAVVGIAVGYSSFTHGRTMLLSAALRPLLGRAVDGVLGKVVDVLAVFAILFGVATSLGLGTLELNSGLGPDLGLPESYGVKIAIIAGLMTVSTISALTGLGRGIRVLSLANIALCGILLAFVLVLGPTVQLFATLGTGLRDYVVNFLPMSFATEGASGGEWTQDWIFFFWAWWIGWSPFVGTFIARISRGRSIRDVMVGVVAVPSAVTVLWFSIFGGTALHRDMTGAFPGTDMAVQSKSVATFAMLDTLPLTGVAMVIVIAVLALLFITSADSASFMLASSTSGGRLKPPRPLRLMWSFAAAFAAVLLLSGGQESLRGAAVIAAMPFTLILFALCLSLARMLWADRGRRGDAETR